MNIRLLLFLSIAFSACGTSKAPQEQYDRITTTTYKNIYDNDHRLLETQSITTLSVYEKGVNTARLETDRQTCSYKYINDTDYIVEESSRLSDEKVITKYIGNTEEKLTLNASGDTVSYLLLQYHDTNRSQLAYSRNIIHSGDLTANSINNYEEESEYDENGNKIKKIQYDRNTKTQKTTHIFEHLPYTEAIQKIPHTNGEYEVVCYTAKTVGDTIIKQEIINGVPDKVEKIITGKGKKQHLLFSKDMKLLESTEDLEKDGFHINVRHSVLGNWSDSTYYKNGKEIRYVNISDKYKLLAISKYDEKGNIIEKIEMTQDLQPQSEEEIMKEMLEKLREEP